MRDKFWTFWRLFCCELNHFCWFWFIQIIFWFWQVIIKWTQIFRKFYCFKKILIFYVLVLYLTFHFKHFCMTQKLFSFRSFFLIVCHETIDKPRKLSWVWGTYFLVFSNHDFFVKFIRCLSSEWRLLHGHFIQNTS